MEKLYIIGFGPGDESLLNDQAKKALSVSRRVLSSARISNSANMPDRIKTGAAGDKIISMTLSEMFSELEKPAEGATSALVSGDCGFFSAAPLIISGYSHLYDIELIPGIGSIQYFSAKIGVPYDGAALISMHGRNVRIAAKAAYNKKIFALTGGVNGAGDICRTLALSGLGNLRVSVGEKLSYPEERIITGSARELKDMAFDGLSVIYIENPEAANPHAPLADADFIRGGAPMTKEEVRWLSIAKMGISPPDIVYDIGSGTGSVSVEMARKAFDGLVFAIDMKEEACALTRENAAKHGAFNLETVWGEAPGAFADLPVPCKAFIGGSSGNMDAILEALVSLNPCIKIVANAVTLQTLNQITSGFAKHRIQNTDIICVNIAKSRKVGGYDMMAAQNPVYIITGNGEAERETAREAERETAWEMALETTRETLPAMYRETGRETSPDAYDGGGEFE
jgi:precorrin-6Y C5,15-methyltransferase (decarboxylating)